MIVGETWGRYVPEFDHDASIRKLDYAWDGKMIERTLGGLPFSLKQDVDDRAAMMQGLGLGGWTDGNACLLHDRAGSTIWAMSGPRDRVLRLIAHQARLVGAGEDSSVRLRIAVDAEDIEARDLLDAISGGFVVSPTANLRIGRLCSLLRIWALKHPPPAGCELASYVIDGGAAGKVSVSIARGKWQVTEGGGTADISVEGADLSGLIFGFPSQVACRLPHGHPLRVLLPIVLHIPPCYAL